MPFGIPRASQHPDFLCHGCGRSFPHKHGAGMYCSPGCEGETLTRKAVEEKKLQERGFTQHSDAAHTWVKDGVSIPIELVLRTSHDEAIKTHAEAVQRISDSRNPQ